MAIFNNIQIPIIILIVIIYLCITIPIVIYRNIHRNEFRTLSKFKFKFTKETSHKYFMAHGVISFLYNLEEYENNDIKISKLNQYLQNCIEYHLDYYLMCMMTGKLKSEEIFPTIRDLLSDGVIEPDSKELNLLLEREKINRKVSKLLSEPIKIKNYPESHKSVNQTDE